MVLVLYEDTATRQRGLVACDYLVNKFWTDIEFKFHWWRIDFLGDSSFAATAADIGSRANLIFLCSRMASEPSSTLKRWFDTWIGRRLEREGLLVNLTTGGIPTRLPHERELFLREISRRAALDYLGTFPQTSTGTLPSSTADAEERANQMSALLDTLLHEGHPPPHFGIND